MKNIYMIKLVRSVVDLFAAGYPARGSNDGIVCCRRMWIVAVEISGVNFAVPARIIFEGDLSQGNAFVLRNRVDEIIRESMSLPPQGCAGIGFCNQAALIEAIGRPALQIAVVAAGNEILRRIGIGEAEALDVQVELEYLGGLSGETAH